MLRINGASGWLAKNSVRKFIPFDLHVLGAPPAFVLSQDQTLYKWYLSLKSVKSLFAQHAIACVLCELLCLELFNVFFQHENRFRYKFFDIVQFSRSCSTSALRLTTWLFYHRSDFLSSSFFEVFRFLSNLERSRFLGAGRNFRTSIGSFRFTSSWDSEVILLSRRLALKYDTIRRAGCQHFFASFLLFFRFWTFSPVFLPVLSCFLLSIFLIITYKHI